LMTRWLPNTFSTPLSCRNDMVSLLVLFDRLFDRVT
jgi:hypothetical protein